MKVKLLLLLAELTAFVISFTLLSSFFFIALFVLANELCFLDM